MLMPSIDRYMTREPYSLAMSDSTQLARDRMLSHSIRHLPVIEGDRLVGVVSQRDVELVAAVPGVDLGRVEVGRIMGPPYYVWSQTPLDEVSDLMSASKTDYVVVRGGRGVEGIFTAVDALAALSDLLRRAC
jgi:acetoin utilization protein AcuB